VTPFAKAYVINLPSRSDRRREMSAELKRIGLEAEWFNAVRPDDRGEFESIGARGCFLSHLGVLRRSLDLESVLILEDDVNFVRDFRWPKIRPDWSIFYGGYRFRPDGDVETTHFVAFRSNAIRLLVPYMEAQLSRRAGDALGGPMHVDGTYLWFRREHPELVTVLARPELGYQRHSRSDIYPGTRRSWFADVARKLRNLSAPP
jgi:glycosyl transferase, family 25